MAVTSREIRLASRPTGKPKASDFELAEVRVPDPQDGEMLVQNLYMTVDPYMRGRMRDIESYVPPFQVGEVLAGGSVGRVLKSRLPGFTEGDIVAGMEGWREVYLSRGAGQRKLDPKRTPLSLYLGVLGMPGLTAYVGLLDIGEPKPGETLFVSAAAGAVGSVVGQIGKIKGLRVVGCAGSSAKVDHLTRKLGFDAAFSYREGNLHKKLAESCPDGIDIYFENVGGELLEAVLLHMRPFGRIPVCGMIAQYNDAEPPPGPRTLITIIPKRLKLQGFIVSDSFHRMADFVRDMSAWLDQGKVRYDETVLEGIESAPRAFLGLFEGENLGKMIVKLGE